MVQEQVELHRALGPAEHRPVKERGTQVDHRGIQAGQFVLEPELPPALGDCLAAGEQLAEDLLVEGLGPMLICVRQGGPARGRDPQVAELPLAGGHLPPQISRRDLARPNWQKSMATNWPQQVKPRAWRSALVSLTARWKSIREKSWRSWLNTLTNRFTVEPPFRLLSGTSVHPHHSRRRLNFQT